MKQRTHYCQAMGWVGSLRWGLCLLTNAASVTTVT